MWKYLFIANERFPSEVYVFLTDSWCAGFILCLSEICTRFDDDDDNDDDDDDDELLLWYGWPTKGV